MHRTANRPNGRSTVKAGLLIATLALAIVAIASPSHAQTRVRVTIDFPFLAGTTTMAAGQYELSVDGSRLTVSGDGPKGQTVFLTVLTRLGRHDTDRDPELVFDKLDGKACLSEVWFPEADGYLVLGTSSEHSHTVIGGSRPRK